MVDLKGFEPSTPTMRMWCAPNCATSPFDFLEIIAFAIRFVKCWNPFSKKNMESFCYKTGIFFVIKFTSFLMFDSVRLSMM